MELGHKVYAEDLARRLADRPDVDVAWFEVHPGALARSAKVLRPLRNDTFRKSTWAATALWPHRSALDVVLVHTQTPALFLPPILRGVPMLLSTDGTPANIDELADAYGHGKGSKLTAPMKKRLTATVFRSAYRVLAWSTWARDSVVEDYVVPADRVDVLAPGVDLRWWSPPADKSPGGVRLLFVGGDFERKGGPLLLRALQCVDDSWTLDVVTRSAVDIQDPRVRVHRNLQGRDERLRTLFRGADVFALPTRGDTYGLVLAQASACGLPVVSTRLAGIPDIVDHGVTGLLTPKDDLAALAGALKGLVGDNTLRARMGKAARATAVARLDGQAATARLLDHARAAARARAGR